MRPKGDLRNDIRCGFEIIRARDIDRFGVNGVIEQLKARVGNTKVYLSVDIDVLDPAFAPGKSMYLFQVQNNGSLSETAKTTGEVLCNFEHQL